MRPSIALVILSIVFANWTFGQTYPLSKVHGWSQATLASINPQGIAQEGGKEIRADANTKFNYYLYAEYRPGFSFTISTIWIKGQAYGVKTEKVTKTPVMLDPTGLGTGGQITTLVPVTNNKVLQLFPSGRMGSHESTAWLKHLVETSDLVIKYHWKGKTWYYALPKIKMLDPMAGV